MGQHDRRGPLPGLPPDPVSPVREAALAAKLLFDELKGAGFTEEQALYLVPQFARNLGNDGDADPQ